MHFITGLGVSSAAYGLGMMFGAARSKNQRLLDNGFYLVLASIFIVIVIVIVSI